MFVFVDKDLTVRGLQRQDETYSSCICFSKVSDNLITRAVCTELEDYKLLS